MKSMQKILRSNAVGIDEVGRGAIAGPVVAAAVLFNNRVACHELDAIGIDDSKKIPQMKRLHIARLITNMEDIKYGIGVSSVKEIDTYGIVNATLVAMQRSIVALYDVASSTNQYYNDAFNMQAILHLKSDVVECCGIIVDGIHNPFYEVCIGDNILKVETMIKGDVKCYNVAAASIIAKVFRDNLMCNISDQLHKCYDWVANKGYGTKKHIDTLAQHGLSQYHRVTFCNRFV